MRTMGSEERSNQTKEKEAKSSSQNATVTEKEDDAKVLFRLAMKNDWGKIVEIYEKSRAAKDAKITKAEDTVLHLAVRYNGLTDIVLKMVKSLEEHEAKAVLSIKNKRGNTPLHEAAIVGDVEMCESMAKKDKELTALRNNENETPLFCAARQGNKLAFRCLKKYSHEQHEDTIPHPDKSDPKKQNHDVSSYRKQNGDTILHAAISGEYLDLAFEILHSYPVLANSVNENAQTPLHVLASKPNLFKSSFRFRLLDYVIYPCVFIDKMISIEKGNDQSSEHNKSVPAWMPRRHPENYQTCMRFFNILGIVFKMIKDIPNDLYVAICKKERPQGGDQENPQTENMIDSCLAICKKEKLQGDDQNNPQTYQGLLPPNYEMIIEYFKLTMKALLIVLGFGISRMQKVIEIKRSHTWAHQLMVLLVEKASSYEYDDNGGKPQDYDPSNAPDTSKPDENSPPLPDAVKTKDTAILIAAKKGVVEVVEEILKVFPVAIQDLDCDNKNVVLLAVENRQPSVYRFLLQTKIMRDSAFRQVDKHGNSALHLAAMAGGHRPWLIPGAALQMQWELKWYKFVKSSMHPQTFANYNEKGQTAEETFKETHEDLIKKGSEWLTKTSESFSVVAALIATVAFSTSSNIPGGVKEDTGTPNLKNQPAFNVFAISSVIALCFSVTALVFFLAILTSRFQEKNFAHDLPRKLLVGLTALFTSVAAILVSFCAGHFYVLGDLVRNAAYPIYAATCFPVTFFVLAQLPLYFDLITAIISKVPQHSYQDFPQ